MYTLMIVDDDELICRGLATCIEWKKLNIEVIGALYDGEMALQQIEKQIPDIMIVDVNMPFINGIELSRILRDKYPQIKIILLTAYKEFEYAQEAIRLQISAYLTKPFHNEEIIETVEKVIGIIEEERSNIVHINNNLDRLKEKQLEELTVSGISENFNLENVNSPENLFQVAIFHIQKCNDNEFRNRISETIEVKIHSAKTYIISKLIDNNFRFFQLNHRIVIVFEHYNHDYIRSNQLIISEIMKYMRELDCIRCYCGMGKDYQGLENVTVSYKEAEYSIGQRFSYPNRSMIVYSELKFKEKQFKADVIQIKQFIKRSIALCDADGIADEIEKLYEKMCDDSSWTLQSMGFFFLNLLGYAYEVTEDVQLYSEFMKNSSMLLGKSTTMENNTELFELVDSSYQILYEYLRRTSITDGERRVNQAIEYMEKNYTDADMSLTDVAEYVGLSPNYLGNLFKKYKDITYVNLLNEIRIGNAKKLLLRTDTKSYEIAYEVGFNSSQYFSSCFKKLVGCTPNSYKNNNSKKCE